MVYKSVTKTNNRYHIKIARHVFVKIENGQKGRTIPLIYNRLYYRENPGIIPKTVKFVTILLATIPKQKYI